jgi:general stress protein 26
MADLNLNDISEKMRDIDFAVLSTRTEGGAVAGRPMSNNRQVEFDGDSYFFTLESTRTVGDIRRDPNVGLTYQSKSGALGLKPFFITVEGRAELIQDKGRFAEHWTKDLDHWFEQGIDTPAGEGRGAASSLLGRLRRRRDLAEAARKLDGQLRERGNPARWGRRRVGQGFPNSVSTGPRLFWVERR